MRTKPAILAFFALATIAMQGLFTSCAGDENLSTEKPSTGTQTLTLNLKLADTRAAAYSDPGTTAEKTINRVTIGIFDQNTGNAVKTIQDAPDPAAPSITTSQLAAGDHILVAVNAPAGTFNGALTESEFEKKTLAIDDALPVSGTGTVDPAKLPMFGTGSIALKSGSTTAYEAIVPVYHMVAKVTLQSLKVDFDATEAYQKATFTPTEVFLLNVPDALDFYPAKDMSSYSTFATYTKLYQGQSSVSANLRPNLGTGTDLSAFTAVQNTTLKGASGAATSSWGSTTAGSKILFLYTMPNTSANPTLLVIKGQFAADGASAVPVFYPVNINYNYNAGTPTAVDGGILKQVYPNINYVIDVTIKGKGTDDPTKSLDPETVTATISVNPFVDATQSNTFN